MRLDRIPRTIGRRSKRVIERVDSRHVMIFSLCLLPVTIALMFPMFENYASSTIFSYLSQDEYAAIKWIDGNTPASAYILTDPGSGFLVRGLTLRNASTFLVLPDGRMPADPSLLYPDLEPNLHSFFSSSSLSDSLASLRAIPFREIRIVVTSRTVSWANSPAETIIYRPVPTVDYASITWKLAPPGFTEVHRSDTVLIYRPSPSILQ